MDRTKQSRTARMSALLLAGAFGLGLAGPASAGITLGGPYNTYHNEFYPFTAQAAFYLTASGEVHTTSDGYVGDWLSPKTGMGNYQYHATYDGNCGQPGVHFTGSSLNTWQTLQYGANWFVYTNVANDYLTCQVDIQIRETSNPSVILGSTTVYFQVGVW